MRTPLLRGSFATVSESDSWLTRVRENLAQLLLPTGLSPTSANGAPIHLLRLRPRASGRAQTLSLFVHIGIVVAISVLVVAKPQKPGIRLTHDTLIGGPLYNPPSVQSTERKPSLGRHSGGGEDNPVPATHGFFPPASAVPLAPPRLPDHSAHLLPVPAAVLDPQAPIIVTAVNPLGIPTMPDETNSAGKGKRHGIGTGNNGGVGDDEGPGAGFAGDEGVYRGISSPTCAYCPLPVYTDEARHVKMQGTVTLRVLVGPDGRASDIRVVRGVGYGLEERAVQTVRGWKFVPGHDANHRPSVSWVTIEAIFRLF